MTLRASDSITRAISGGQIEAIRRQTRKAVCADIVPSCVNVPNMLVMPRIVAALVSAMSWTMSGSRFAISFSLPKGSNERMPVSALQDAIFPHPQSAEVT